MVIETTHGLALVLIGLLPIALLVGAIIGVQLCKRVGKENR